MIVSLIAALGKKREIGLDGGIPWHVSSDFKHFKKTTMGHIMVMGRKNFECIGKPLPGRKTIVMTRKESYDLPENCYLAHSKEEVLKIAKDLNETELFICGGADIYELFLEDTDRFYLSEIDYEGPADVYFPEYGNFDWKVEEEKVHDFEGELSWTFKLLTKKVT